VLLDTVSIYLPLINAHVQVFQATDDVTNDDISNMTVLQCSKHFCTAGFISNRPSNSLAVLEKFGPKKC
jgi:hypothetical protein